MDIEPEENVGEIASQFGPERSRPETPKKSKWKRKSSLMQKMKAALKMEIQRDEDEEAAKKQKELEEQGCSV